MRRAALLAILAVPAFIPAADGAGASASDAVAGEVAMRHAAFDPSRLSVLVEDTVHWMNASDRTHNLKSSSAVFDSGRIPAGGSYSRAYAALGSYGYACTIHPGMTGVIDVYALLLEGPQRPVAAGSPVVLTGRAATGTGLVTIEEDRGAGFRPVATAIPDSTSNFQATVRPQAATSYRAVASGRASPAVRVAVAAPLTLIARTGRKRVRLSVVAVSAPPGTLVALQYYLPERFGWWRVRRRRLGPGSRASFRVRRPAKGRRVRAVLTEPDGYTVTAVSNAVKLRPAHRRRHRHRSS